MGNDLIERLMHPALRFSPRAHLADTCLEAATALTEAASENEELRFVLAVMGAIYKDLSLADVYCPTCGSCGEDGCGCTHKCLYAHSHPDVLRDMDQAASRIKELEEGLRPFASWADDNTAPDPFDEGYGIWAGNRSEGERIRDWFGPSDFNTARQLIQTGDKG